MLPHAARNLYFENILLLTEWEVSAGIYCLQLFPYKSMWKRPRVTYSCTDRSTQLIRALLPSCELTSTLLVHGDCLAYK